MKTSKLLMVATIVAIVMASFAITTEVKAGSDTPPTTPNVVHITLTQAIQHTVLVNAMYNQLDDNFLVGDHFWYTQPVLYNGTIFMISGTLNQWLNFFKLKPIFVAADRDL